MTVFDGAEKPGAAARCDVTTNASEWGADILGTCRGDAGETARLVPRAHRHPADASGSSAGQVPPGVVASSTCRAFGAEPAHPAVSALPRDAELSSDMSDGPAVTKDPLDEQGPAVNGQTGVNVDTGTSWLAVN